MQAFPAFRIACRNRLAEVLRGLIIVVCSPANARGESVSADNFLQSLNPYFADFERQPRHPARLQQ
jgi:hypothetical protein